MISVSSGEIQDGLHRPAKQRCRSHANREGVLR
jgi:hypothetical protein